VRKKDDLSAFEHIMFVGSICSISETADLLGFSCITISRFYGECTVWNKICNLETQTFLTICVLSRLEKGFDNKL